MRTSLPWPLLWPKRQRLICAKLRHKRPRRCLPVIPKSPPRELAVTYPWEAIRGPRRLIRHGQPVYLRDDGSPSVWCRSAVYRLGSICLVTKTHVVVTVPVRGDTYAGRV